MASLKTAVGEGFVKISEILCLYNLRYMHIGYLHIFRDESFECSALAIDDYTMEKCVHNEFVQAWRTTLRHTVNMDKYINIILYKLHKTILKQLK